MREPRDIHGFYTILWKCSWSPYNIAEIFRVSAQYDGDIHSLYTILCRYPGSLHNMTEISRSLHNIRPHTLSPILCVSLLCAPELYTSNLAPLYFAPQYLCPHTLCLFTLNPLTLPLTLRFKYCALTFCTQKFRAPYFAHTLSPPSPSNLRPTLYTSTLYATIIVAPSL